jgi:hypothetical protein
VLLSAIKSGKAFCAAAAHLSLAFHLFEARAEAAFDMQAEAIMRWG